jgi:hypothetical protein
MPPDPDAFDPLPLLEALAAGSVDFVLIGAVAGGSYGSAYGTFDVDVAYARDRENTVRLAGVLRELEGSPLLDALAIENGSHFTFATAHGALDIVADPTGAPPYAELKRAGTRIDVGEHEVVVASLDHLIAMKQASARTRDTLLGTEYRVLSDELRAPRNET